MNERLNEINVEIDKIARTVDYDIDKLNDIQKQKVIRLMAEEKVLKEYSEA